MGMLEVAKTYIGVHLNTKPAEQEMKGALSGLSKAASGVGTSLGDAITGGLVTALKAGGIAAAVVAVVKLGKECVNLGSDLTEVQNVVDTTFGGMTQSVNEWAAAAGKQFGLSETMAKEFAGYYGAMAKSAGISGQQLIDMSTSLAGMAGDVASFYNMSQEDAYNKLKGVFTGETEGLKGIGVVMTQTNLDAFALANGFNKTTKEMSESEKVALRYTYVMNALSGASGDWQKTLGDSWSNQVKYLKLQLEQLGAVLGQLIIPMLLKVVKAINWLLEQILALANAIRRLFGLEELGTVARGVETDMSGIADSAADAADGVDGVGDSVKGTAAAIKRSLLGFDEINKLMDNTAASAGEASGALAGIGDAAASTGTVGSFTDPGGEITTEPNGVIEWGRYFDNLSTMGGTLTVDFRTVTIPGSVRRRVQSELDAMMGAPPFSSDASVEVSFTDDISIPKDLRDRIGAELYEALDKKFAFKAVAQIGITDDISIPQDLRDRIDAELHKALDKKFVITVPLDVGFNSITAVSAADNDNNSGSGFSHSSGTIDDFSHSSGTMPDSEYHSFFGEGYWYKLFGLSEWKEDNAGWAAEHPTLAWLLGLGPYPGTTTPVVDVIAELTGAHDRIPKKDKSSSGWKGVVQTVQDKLTAGQKTSAGWKGVIQTVQDRLTAAQKTSSGWVAKIRETVDNVAYKWLERGADFTQDYDSVKYKWLERGADFTQDYDSVKYKWLERGADFIKDYDSVAYKWIERGADFTKDYDSVAYKWLERGADFIKDYDSVESAKKWLVRYASLTKDYDGVADSKKWLTRYANFTKDYDDVAAAKKWMDRFANFTKAYDSIPAAQKSIDVTANVTNVDEVKDKIKTALGLKAGGGVFAGGAWRPVTAYASGGSPAGGQLFVAREAGPELVGTIGGHTAVMNNDQIVASVAAGVARAIAGVRFISRERATPRLAFIGESVSRSEQHLASIDSRLEGGAAGSGPETLSLLRQIAELIRQLDVNAYLDGDDVTDHVLRRLNARTRAAGVSEVPI